MRTRYRLPILGRLRIDCSFPIQGRVFNYELEANAKGVVTYLNATAQANDRNDWPRIDASFEPGISAHVHLTSPHFDVLRQEIRAASGILALFGVDEIVVE